MSEYAILAVIVVVLFGVGFLLRLGRGSVRRSWYAELLKLTRGDDEMAERLMSKERARNPKASRERLAQLAVARWKKDLR